MKGKFLASAAGVGLLATGASANVQLTWDQQHDFINGLASEVNTIVSQAFTADDFNIGDKPKVKSLVAYMIVTIPPPGDYGFNIYADDPNGGPLKPDPIKSREGADSVEDLGTWNGTSFHLFKVTFKQNIVLDQNTWYWFSPYGIGNGQNNDRAFWGTSGAGAINGLEGYFQSDFFGFFDWTRVTDVLGAPTDFAFEVWTIPSPGALALLGLAGLATRRRRRA